MFRLRRMFRMLLLATTSTSLLLFVVHLNAPLG
jgi:hypothetical protein